MPKQEGQGPKKAQQNPVGTSGPLRVGWTFCGEGFAFLSLTLEHPFSPKASPS